MYYFVNISPYLFVFTFAMKFKNANYKNHWNDLVFPDQWKMMSDLNMRWNIFMGKEKLVSSGEIIGSKKFEAVQRSFTYSKNDCVPSIDACEHHG